LTKTRRAIIQLLIGALAIGLSPIFAKWVVATGGVSPIGAGFWRMGIGALGFGAWILLSSPRQNSIGDMWQTLRFGLAPIIVAGILFACDLTAWHTSFGHTSVSASTLIANLSSIFVPVCGVLFFKEKFKSRLAVGGLLALLGAVGIALFKSVGGRDQSHDSLILGEGLAFMTAFFYTGYMLVIKKLAGTFSSSSIMLISSGVSAILLCVLANFLGENILPLTNEGWLWIFALGLISQTMGQGLIASALSVLPVSQSALILLAAPTSSAVYGWVLLGESLSLVQIVCVGVTLLGIALVARR
jgi:drug/metabolite transporter (DMT)-like permease